jgi:biotin transport system substrate-specific component
MAEKNPGTLGGRTDRDRRTIARRAVRIAVAVAAIAAAARLAVPVPGSGVPQSAQTLAVVLAGAWLGARDGGLALITYLAAGAAGLPVFADGADGPSHLYGPTAGYLFGFVIGAWAIGRAADRGALARPLVGFAVFLAAHTLILILGGAWLSRSIGLAAAVREGVAPFLIGAVTKSALAAGIVALIGARRRTGDEAPAA